MKKKEKNTKLIIITKCLAKIQASSCVNDELCARPECRSADVLLKNKIKSVERRARNIGGKPKVRHFQKKEEKVIGVAHISCCFFSL